MGATRRFKSRLLIQPEIRDSDPPEVKDAFALRHAANADGRCPSCGATFVTVWHSPKVGQRLMEHEAWCKAATDTPDFFEAITAALRKIAAENT